MELSDYELIRYPSGQVVITRVAMTANGPASGPRDVIGAYTNEQDAQSALHRLSSANAQMPAAAPDAVQRG